MRALIIEASTERGAIAIGEDSRIIVEKHLPFGLQQSSLLMPFLENLLNQASMNIKDMDVIGIGVGPGSYTGIRVAAAIAMTIAYAINRPLISFCSLCAFVPNHEGPFAAIIDAKIGGAYLLKGTKNANGIRYTAIPTAVPLSDLIEFLKDTTHLVTPNHKNLENKLQAIYPHQSLTWHEKCPDLAHLLKIVHHKFELGQVDTPESLELLYLRKTQAEIEKGPSL